MGEEKNHLATCLVVAFLTSHTARGCPESGHSPKFKLRVSESDTPKKLKGTSDKLVSKEMQESRIFHFQTAAGA